MSALTRSPRKGEAGITRTIAKLAVCGLAAAALLGGGAHRAAAAELGDAAYCPYGSVSGTGSWTPAVTAALGGHSIVLDVQASCSGIADEDGGYTMALAGSSNENCGAPVRPGGRAGPGLSMRERDAAAEAASRSCAWV